MNNTSIPKILQKQNKKVFLNTATLIEITNTLSQYTNTILLNIMPINNYLINNILINNILSNYTLNYNLHTNTSQINTLTKQYTYTQQIYKKYLIQTHYLYQHAYAYKYYDHFRKYSHKYHYQHQYKHQNHHPYQYTCQNEFQLKYQIQPQNQQHYQKQHQYSLQFIYPQYRYRTQHQKSTTKALPINTAKIQNIIPKQCLNHKTGSAFRPRHINRNIYHFTNNWAPRRITNHTPKNNTNTHFSIN